MPLFNVHRFSNIKPHIAYRFDCDIWEESADDTESRETCKFLTFAVKNVSQPAFKLNTDNRKHFGNTQYVIPILKYGETELNITFTEMEYMRVYEFLTKLYGTEPYFGLPTKFVHIVIREYDITMERILTSRHYVTRLKSFDIPEFNNNGYGEPVEITASFYVEYTYPTEANIQKLITKKTLENGEEIAVRVRNDLKPQLKDTELNAISEERAKMEEKQKLDETPVKPFKKSAAQEKREKEIDTEIQTLREKENKAVRLILNVNENPEEVRKEDIRIARQNYAAELRNQQSGIKNSEQLSIEYYNSLSEAEKEAFIIKYAYGIDMSDGINVDEIKRLQYYAQQKGLSAEDMELVENTLVDINSANMTIDKLEKEKKKLSYGVNIPVTKTVVVDSGKNKSTIDIGNSKIDVDGKSVSISYYDITESTKKKSSFNQEGIAKTTKASIIEMHRTGENRPTDEKTKLNGFVDNGVAIFIDKSGQISMNIDRVVDAHSSASGSKKAKGKSTIAIEMGGAVAIAKGSDGKYYERVVTGQKDDNKRNIIWREITDVESRGLIEYTAENTTNKTLLESAERNKKTYTALTADGTKTPVTMTNIYAEKYTEEQLTGLKAAGKALKQQGVELSDVMSVVSHGGVEGYKEEKTEGIDAYNEMALKALLEGYYSE